MPPEISCERVRKIYGQGANAFEAVHAATFSVEKGEFVSLLGPSGCGKSTLLMMIGGLEALSDGRVFAAGTPVEEPRPEIGIVFQDPTLLPWKTAIQNILFPIEMMHRKPRRSSSNGLPSFYVWSDCTTLRTNSLGSFPAG